MNKILIVSIVSALVLLTGQNYANAAIINWNSEKNKDVSGTERNWSFDSLYSSIKGFAVTSNSSLPQVSGEAVVQTQTPVSTPAKARKVTQKSYTVSASAYSSTPDQTDDSPFITASGTYVRDGIIAANFLPFGTAVKIPDMYGDKIFIVEDRMNKRYMYNIDIWFPDRESAKIFGRRTVRIEIVS